MMMTCVCFAPPGPIFSLCLKSKLFEVLREHAIFWVVACLKIWFLCCVSFRLYIKPINYYCKIGRRAWCSIWNALQWKMENWCVLSNLVFNVGFQVVKSPTENHGWLKLFKYLKFSIANAGEEAGLTLGWIFWFLFFSIPSRSPTKRNFTQF